MQTRLYSSTDDFFSFREQIRGWPMVDCKKIGCEVWKMPSKPCWSKNQDAKKGVSAHILERWGRGRGVVAHVNIISPRRRELSCKDNREDALQSGGKAGRVAVKMGKGGRSCSSQPSSANLQLILYFFCPLPPSFGDWTLKYDGAVQKYQIWKGPAIQKKILHSWVIACRGREKRGKGLDDLTQTRFDLVGNVRKLYVLSTSPLYLALSDHWPSLKFSKSTRRRVSDSLANVRISRTISIVPFKYPNCSGTKSVANFEGAMSPAQQSFIMTERWNDLIV